MKDSDRQQALELFRQQSVRAAEEFELLKPAAFECLESEPSRRTAEAFRAALFRALLAYREEVARLAARESDPTSYVSDEPVDVEKLEASARASARVTS